MFKKRPLIITDTWNNSVNETPAFTDGAIIPIISVTPVDGEPEQYWFEPTMAGMQSTIKTFQKLIKKSQHNPTMIRIMGVHIDNRMPRRDIDEFIKYGCTDGNWHQTAYAFAQYIPDHGSVIVPDFTKNQVAEDSTYIEMFSMIYPLARIAVHGESQKEVSRRVPTVQAVTDSILGGVITASVAITTIVVFRSRSVSR